jgi:hypothetical protein
MQGEMPFYEDPEQALEACVQALGGAKKVGPMLWPDKGIDNARTYLLACLNSDRPEKLSYSQIVFIFKEARAIGFHAGFEWFAHQCEYEARPITRAEEMDRLTSVIESSSKTLAGALALLERLQATKTQ